MLEICSFPAHLDYHDVGDVERAGRQMRELHLEPYSFHAPFAERIDITALDPTARRVAFEEINQAAEAAARLGARYLVLHPGPEKSGLPRSERLDRMENAAQVLGQVAERCSELGLLLVLENMLPHLFSGHVRDLLWLLGSLATTRVGICLDTGHALLSGDLHNVVHKLSGHLWMLHASDNRGTYDDHLPPGEGKIDWAALVAQLDAHGFAGVVILEVAQAPDILERARRSRLFLRELMTRSGSAPRSAREPGR